MVWIGPLATHSVVSTVWASPRPVDPKDRVAVSKMQERSGAGAARWDMGEAPRNGDDRPLEKEQAAGKQGSYSPPLSQSASTGEKVPPPRASLTRLGQFWR